LIRRELYFRKCPLGTRFCDARCSWECLEILFSTSFCLDLILASSVENGRIMGLSGLFRSPWFPLGIGVEDSVLEIVGLDSKLGLIMREFAF